MCGMNIILVSTIDSRGQLRGHDEKMQNHCNTRKQ